MLNNGSCENMATPPPCVMPHAPKSKVDIVDDYEYVYVTEALSSYPNCYTTEWDALFENIKAPMCDDISSYFFNPDKPLLPLDVLIPYEPQNTNDGDNNDSSKLVVNESNNQVNMTNHPLASSVMQRKQGRIMKTQYVTAESDVDVASSLLTMSQKVNQAPKKRQKLLNCM
ncbi:hypothetical protein TSUD_155330 [Trifolium subterraneum]|uniref:Uncharacterized protein n=1 Tax=Trifolium subterraneum TaxID=3900 RepID=A0A2Z6NFT1_TRISU|nr:hypothetical protein TSUD_155330 [Trifolium subterraneum]